MLIPLRDVYLIGSIIASIPWLAVYLVRRDLRREMLVMSVLFMVPSVLAEYFVYTVDYWRPMTAEGTRIGVEDVILGFTNGGLIAVCFEFFLGKAHVPLTRRRAETFPLVAAGLLLTVLLVLFFGFHVNSSIATPIAFLVGVVVLVSRRRDLIVYSLGSGAIAVVGATPVYLILEYLSPAFVERTWLFGNLTGIRLLGIPIEDLIYYFAVGCFLGTFYLCWKNEGIGPARFDGEQIGRARPAGASAPE